MNGKTNVCSPAITHGSLEIERNIPQDTQHHSILQGFSQKHRSKMKGARPLRSVTLIVCEASRSFLFDLSTEV